MPSITDYVPVLDIFFPLACQVTNLKPTARSVLFKYLGIRLTSKPSTQRSMRSINDIQHAVSFVSSSVHVKLYQSQSAKFLNSIGFPSALIELSAKQLTTPLILNSRSNVYFWSSVHKRMEGQHGCISSHGLEVSTPMLNEIMILVCSSQYSSFPSSSLLYRCESQTHLVDEADIVDEGRIQSMKERSQSLSQSMILLVARLVYWLIILSIVSVILGQRLSVILYCYSTYVGIPPQ